MVRLLLDRGAQIDARTKVQYLFALFAYASNNGSLAEGSFIRYSMKFLQSRLLGYLCLAYRGWPIYILLGVNQVFRMYGLSWDSYAK